MVSITELLAMARNINFFNRKGIEDAFDHLAGVISTTIFSFGATILVLNVIIRHPISCYLATDPGGKNAIDFIENYCWVRGTYTPVDRRCRDDVTGQIVRQSFPQTEREWRDIEQHRILYYQWIPVMLVIQAALFAAPKIALKMRLLPHSLKNANNHIKRICAANEKFSGKCFKESDESRARLINLLCTDILYNLSPSLRVKKCRTSQLNFQWNLTVCRVPLCVAYLLLKAVYCAVAALQLAIIRFFLQQQQLNLVQFGVHLLSSVWHNGDTWWWPQQQHGGGAHRAAQRGELDWTVRACSHRSIFPRVTFCHVPFKLAGVQTNFVTAQCVLSTNAFAEKIYVVLYLWTALVCVLSLFGVLALLVYYAMQLCKFARAKFLSKNDNEEEAYGGENNKNNEKERLQTCFSSNTARNAANLAARLRRTFSVRHHHHHHHHKQNNTNLSEKQIALLIDDATRGKRRAGTPRKNFSCLVMLNCVLLLKIASENGCCNKLVDTLQEGLTNCYQRILDEKSRHLAARNPEQSDEQNDEQNNEKEDNEDEKQQRRRPPSALSERQPQNSGEHFCQNNNNNENNHCNSSANSQQRQDQQQQQQQERHRILQV